MGKIRYGCRKTDNDKIKFGFRETGFLTRWPCHICGGLTEKDGVLCEVLDGDHAGLRICPTCLQHIPTVSVNERLMEYISDLEDRISYLQSMLGRIQVPTYTEWCAAERKYWQEYEEAEREAITLREKNAEHDRIFDEEQAASVLREMNGPPEPTWRDDRDECPF